MWNVIDSALIEFESKIIEWYSNELLCIKASDSSKNYKKGTGL